MGTVALVNMPFAMANRPPVGISTLKGCLSQRGIACDLHYFNLMLARWIGPELYQQISDRASHMVFAGEWLFAQELFDRHQIGDVEYLEHIRWKLGVPPGLVDTFVRLRSFIAPFLDRCLHSVDWSGYRIVGFTSMFEQNLATLALAARIKRLHPDVVLVMGGANCEGEMGECLHRCFPALDCVFTGQSDWSFPRFVENTLADKPIDEIPGLVLRRNGVSVTTGRPEPVGPMDRLPVPDYDDYVRQLDAYELRGAFDVRLQFETSRGCWWGMKQHCTFCGFNAETMQFGSKSPDRVVQEIEYLAARYGTQEFDAVDNILDHRFFTTVLPRLVGREPPLSLFYEIKSNLRREQVELLAAAGVRYIQPGIESLSTAVLKIMKKGLSALQNIQVLKWCREFGVMPSWNLIYGFPGELPDSYAEMVTAMRRIHHLPAPRGSGKIRLDRFSPHWTDPGAYGLENVRPLEVYRFLYPLPEEDRRGIAYFFDFDYGDRRDVAEYTAAVESEILAWRASEARGAFLSVSELECGDSVIVDGRAPGSPRMARLEGWRARAYELLDQEHSRAALLHEAREKWGVEAEVVDSFLDWGLDHGLLLAEDDRYLALAVRAQPSSEDSLAINLSKRGSHVHN